MAPPSKLMKAFKAQRTKLERQAKIKRIPQHIYELGCTGSQTLDYDKTWRENFGSFEEALENINMWEDRLLAVAEANQIDECVANMGTLWEPDEDELDYHFDICYVCGELCSCDGWAHCDVSIKPGDKIYSVVVEEIHRGRKTPKNNDETWQEFNKLEDALDYMKKVEKYLFKKNKRGQPDTYSVKLQVYNRKTMEKKYDC